MDLASIAPHQLAGLPTASKTPPRCGENNVLGGMRSGAQRSRCLLTTVVGLLAATWLPSTADADEHPVTLKRLHLAVYADGEHQAAVYEKTAVRVFSDGTPVTQGNRIAIPADCDWWGAIG